MSDTVPSLAPESTSTDLESRALWDWDTGTAHSVAVLVGLSLPGHGGLGGPALYDIATGGRTDTCGAPRLRPMSSEGGPKLL